MRLKFHFAALLLALIIAGEQANSGDHAWRVSALEIDGVLRHQNALSQRLALPLKAGVCFEGGTKFMASFQGQKFLAPCSFIHETLRHLKEVLESSLPISLDTNHAHLAVPSELWEAKYSKLPRADILAELLQERALVAIYHTAEYLPETDTRTVAKTRAPTGRKEKQHILGFYDGRSIGILPYQTKESRFTLPPQYRSAAWLFFRPHRGGELAVNDAERVFAFDLSFDANLTDSNSWQEEQVRFDDMAR